MDTNNNIRQIGTTNQNSPRKASFLSSALQQKRGKIKLGVYSRSQ